MCFYRILNIWSIVRVNKNLHSILFLLLFIIALENILTDDVLFHALHPNLPNLYITDAW